MRWVGYGARMEEIIINTFLSERDYFEVQLQKGG
jgi:hypothetical protein